MSTKSPLKPHKKAKHPGTRQIEAYLCHRAAMCNGLIPLRVRPQVVQCGHVIAIDGPAVFRLGRDEVPCTSTVRCLSSPRAQAEGCTSSMRMCAAYDTMHTRGTLVLCYC